MPEVHVLAVLAAALVVFVIGATYYSVVPPRWAGQSDAGPAASQPPPWVIAVEFGRGLVLAAVVAGVASQGKVDGLAGGLLLGLVLWIGFPFVLWAGAIVHENTPWRLAAVHAGDWLIKLVVVGALVSVWQ